MKQNINDIFFGGIYKEIWRKLIPKGLTEAEVDFIEDICNLEKGNHVLDLMCGYGRHTLELANRGYKVTALDNSSDYIAEINGKVKDGGLSIECREADVANTVFERSFDAAICMGNSFAFFDEEAALQLLKNLSAALPVGAIFIINTWTIGEIAIKYFQERTWINVEGGYKYLTENKYLFNPTRIEAESFIVSPGGTTLEVINGIDYIFTISELQTLLKKGGFELREVFSTPRKRKFVLGDAKAYIVAERV
ncbi:class I SAM-dependent methyltransferase [Chitinophagaceae bacterium LB-8]|uniref:Class I SAM-dependent methyltransferase n=1 Tax=Paraflavisolibacter caeni TaxID=2982496 RepID=A0A9X3BGU7_9BACT|nr:class I SAM-dependent methyltransferase [Paraflavisolibacter caeni]MCU7548392.1 class I SAM-dependent methyltransferase [Paraflavisolibacter caeni]